MFLDKGLLVRIEIDVFVFFFFFFFLFDFLIKEGISMVLVFGQLANNLSFCI